MILCADFMLSDSRSEEEVLGFEPLQVKDLPVRYSGNVETVFELLGDIIRGFKNSSGVILNTFEDLERPELAYLRESLPIPIFAIGPFHKFGSSRPLPPSSSPMNNSQSVVEDKGCISWLDKQLPKSVIYVSFGSVAAVSETEFSEIALGLADSRQPFLWVIRSDSVKNHDSGWLEKLPSCFHEALEKRGKIVKWAPQIEVLGHRSVGAFWTHNGWNSTIESVSEGVPMLCMPCFADQTVNARHVSDVWRVGVHLNGELERANIAKAIKRLLVEREGEELRERMSQLKEKADLGWKLGGSSHQSFDRLVNHILSAEL